MAHTGRKRLSLLLCGLSVTACLVLMGAVLLFYGLPYNPAWWWVMGVILLAAAVLPLGLVLAIEWVIEGYQSKADD